MYTSRENTLTTCDNSDQLFDDALCFDLFHQIDEEVEATMNTLDVVGGTRSSPQQQSEQQDSQTGCSTNPTEQSIFDKDLWLLLTEHNDDDYRLDVHSQHDQPLPKDDAMVVDGFAADEQQELFGFNAFDASPTDLDFLTQYTSTTSPISSQSFDQSNNQNTSHATVQGTAVGCKKASKFEQSTFVEKKKRTKKTKQSDEQATNKRAKKSKTSPDLLEHTKFSESAPYLEIYTDSKEMEIVIEVAQSKRRQNGPLESDKSDIRKYCELAYKLEQLDTNNVNYVSLKGKLDKKTIYGDEKATKVYTWIRVKGTTEYLFLYCQTGKTQDVHNIMTINNKELVSSRSDHLSKYSSKCSDTVRVIGPKQTKY